jgi:hypothetical protein
MGSTWVCSYEVFLIEQTFVNMLCLPRETDEAMCVSIEMYAHDDCWSLDAEDSPRLSWPTGRTVYVRIAADKTNVENIYLNPPTLVRISFYSTVFIN